MGAALILILLLAPGIALAHTDDSGPSPWAQRALADALDASRGIEDPFHRSQALTEIAQAQFSTGLDALGLESLDAATAAAREVSEGALRAWALHDIALALTRAGQLDEAEALADSIPDSRLRDAVLAEVVDARRSAHEVERAIQLAQRIRDSARQGQALRTIAISQTADGDYEGALRTARSIHHGPSNATALGDVAAALASQGDFAAARSLAWRIRDAERRSRAFAEVAMAQALAGDRRGALALVEQIEDRFIRAQALAHVAASHGKTASDEVREMFSRAAGLASGGRGPAARRCFALAEVARAQIIAGDYAGARRMLGRALEVLPAVKARPEQIALLSKIAPLLARAGDYPAAYAAAMRAEDGSLRPLLVRDIAAAQAQSGESEAALRLIGGISNPLAATAALMGVLRVQTQSGDARGVQDTLTIALRHAREIAGPDLRAAALGSIAAAYVRAGDPEAAQQAYDEAMRIAGNAERGIQQATTYARIADALGRRRAVEAD